MQVDYNGNSVAVPWQCFFFFAVADAGRQKRDEN